ncbi:MAG TPA: hypothetical protein PLZ05_01820 [Alphaproteobacteria bacterium]|nr:hypothetical protein [Alphaproteobacteria bacterium]
MVKLSDFLEQKSRKSFAVDTGTQIHKKMQKIVIDDTLEISDSTLIQQIKLKNTISPFFQKSALTEVPIAGIIDGKFISRRIDRMLKDDDKKAIVFLDYKTDINKKLFYEKYTSQMIDYKKLLARIYPDYSIRGIILWLNDFTLEEVC